MNYLAPELRLGTVAPLSRAEEDAFYGVPLTATAVEIGEQAVTDDMELVAKFLNECSGDREHSDYFGQISSPELVRSILLNKNATDAQLAAAAREFRTRLISHHAARVLHEANRAMRP